MTTAPAASTGPASPAERQFWLAEQIAPAAPANRAITRIRMDGRVDRRALDSALRALGRRHEALRTAFALQDRRLMRRVLARPPRPPHLDLPPGADFETAAAVLTAPDALDLAQGRVHRVAVSADDDGATVFIGLHHIAYDGLSGEILAADLARAYAATADGRAPGLPVSHRPDPRPLDPDRRERLVGHWRATLDAVPDLPGGGSGPRELAYATLAEHREVRAPELWQTVREQARRSACSPYAVLLAAYASALSDLSGAKDFCVGTPVSTRTAQQQDEVGCLINTVPIRLREPSAPGAVKRLWAAVIDGMNHLALPSEDIVRACRTSPSRRMPIYQALFGYQSWPRPVHAAGGIRLRTVPVRQIGALAEIQLQLCRLDDGALEAVVQAPADGVWAARLPELARSLTDRLAANAEPIAGSPP